ncbi:GNAT family N-acetyltransferase [Thermoplasmatales archaeon AK]|nr:GNAT family N-acetyltransferase [Thermoplasmatales archaeon AK]
MIEPAKPRDWPKISEISRISGYDDYINKIGPSYLESGLILVWRDVKDIRGFLKIEYLSDNSAWLSGLRVDPDYRRKSIGSELTARAIELAKNAGKEYVRMLIHDGNSKSSGLVSKLGFSSVSRFAFFKGTPLGEAIEDEVPQDRNDIRYLNLGWVFISYRFINLVSARFIRFGKIGSAVTVNGRDFQIIAPDEEIRLSGEGFTCLEVHGNIPDYLEELLDREFDYASVFEKRIQQ